MTILIEVATNAAATTWADVTYQVDLTTATFGGEAWQFSIAQGSGFDLIDDAAIRTLAGRRVVRITNLEDDYRTAAMAKLPLSYWRFGEPSGTTATDELGLRNGTYVNTPDLAVSGAMTGDTNTAITLKSASSEHVTLADDVLNSNFEGTHAWAVGLWVKPVTIDATARRLFAFYLTATARGIIAYADNTGTYLSRETGSGATLISGAVLPTGVWSFILWTYSGTHLRYYLNGELVTTVADSASTAVLTGALYRFGVDTSGVSFWNGSIDEAAVWGRALSGDEVLDLYDSGTDPYPVLQDTVLFRGRVVSAAVGRGSLVVGNARVFDVELADYNQDVRGLVVDQWNRPIETDHARLTALRTALLAGSPRASTNLNISTYAPNTNTVSMPKRTYERTDPAGVLAHLIEQSDKAGFVTVDGQIFYQLRTSTAYAAGLSITDVNPNGTTSFGPSWSGPAATRDGAELFSAATLVQTNGKRIGPTIRTATETAHDVWRTVISDDDRTKTSSVQALTNWLNAYGKDDWSYRCSINLKASQVHLIKWGQTVSFRAAAAAQLSAITLRVTRLMWSLLPDGSYKAELEMRRLDDED